MRQWTDLTIDRAPITLNTNTLTGKTQHCSAVLISTLWYIDMSPIPHKKKRSVTVLFFLWKGKYTCQMPRRAAVLWLCDPSVSCGPSVGLQHLCYWYYSLSRFSCLGEARASKFGPTDPALLSAALNINTCLRGPVNTRYRDEAMKVRFLPRAWGWKVGRCRRGEEMEKRHKCKGVWKEPLRVSDNYPPVAAAVACDSVLLQAKPF